MTDLWAEIDTHLERMRSRSRFTVAMRDAEWQHELLTAIRPFIRGPMDVRAAAEFMAAMLRERSRD